MLSLLLILLSLGRLTSTDHHSEASLLQITVPEKIETNTKDGDMSETQVTYAIKIDQQTYTLHLKKQSFLDPHFLVYSYNKSGTLYPDSSLIKGHCFYQGHAAEIPKSAVTLSICSGLRGLLQLDKVSYGIEPLESAATYEHMLYQIQNNKIDFLPIEENYPMTQLVDQSYRILVKQEENSDVVQLKRTLKIQIIMDKALYDYMGSEVAVAAEKVVYIFGLINTMFSQLKLTVKLTSLELWSDQNKIPSNGDANEVLQRFVSWKERFLIQRSHDMAFLLIYRNSPNYVGATYHGMACDPKLAAGIALYPKMITLEAFSVVMVQLLGINLGLTYDDIYNCYCPGTTCIMNPQAIRSRGVKFFSSCSIDEFKHIVSQPEFKCLQNQTISKVNVQGRESSCGNSFKESHEECDCGLPEQCSHKKCCHPENCTLIGKSECGSGPCCDKNSCQISERGRICRISTNPCDFTEFCDGNSEFCLNDITSADFETCSNKTAFCYKGRCRDPDRQCVELFGKFAKASTYLCAEEVNFLQDDFGNCDKNRCDFRHTLCGKIVCHWTHSRIVPSTDFDIQYTYLGGHVCMSGYLRNQSQVPTRNDKTYVYDGTICGANKICEGGYCKLISELQRQENCNSQKNCSGHGMCNSRNNCHCDVGYGPPNCELMPSSPGGSIDDGYWSIIGGGKIAHMPVKRPGTHRKNGLLISFCIFLPFLILIAIIAFKWNKMRFWKREGTVSGGSISEDGSSDSNTSYTELKVN
ncbi:A disintegrin and metallopeptidase domain 3 [Pteropus alecto]|uniref:A disintegrin and metallopeptidase domain 3 n=1 Tax=Pteropus alecto TaxID=9402 RepID=UPI000D531662|nr:A disintegrin and metallopeptidase domain 3 [Pteropus alecto]